MPRLTPSLSLLCNIKSDCWGLVQLDGSVGGFPGNTHQGLKLESESLLFENEKMISWFVGISKCCDQSGDTATENDKRYYVVTNVGHAVSK